MKGRDGTVLLDEEFDDTEEHDTYIIEQFKEIADDIRDSTDVHGS
jgi:hypothetical protein